MDMPSTPWPVVTNARCVLACNWKILAEMDSSAPDSPPCVSELNSTRWKVFGQKRNTKVSAASTKHALLRRMTKHFIWIRKFCPAMRQIKIWCSWIWGGKSESTDLIRPYPLLPWIVAIVPSQSAFEAFPNSFARLLWFGPGHRSI